MVASDFVVGNLYFLVKYEDEKLTRPIIATYEYVGVEPRDADGCEYLFKDIACDDELLLHERDLWNVVDMPGLIDELKRFHAAGKGAREDAS